MILPMYSQMKTTKKGVTRSFIPWTYPLAGWRMAHMNSILSKIWKKSEHWWSRKQTHQKLFKCVHPQDTRYRYFSVSNIKYNCFKFQLSWFFLIDSQAAWKNVLEPWAQSHHTSWLLQETLTLWPPSPAGNRCVWPPWTRPAGAAAPGLAVQEAGGQTEEWTGGQVGRGRSAAGCPREWAWMGRGTGGREGMANALSVPHQMLFHNWQVTAYSLQLSA